MVTRNDLERRDRKLDLIEAFIKAYDAYVAHPAYGDFDMADEKEIDELIALERAMMDARAAIGKTKIS